MAQARSSIIVDGEIQAKSSFKVDGIIYVDKTELILKKEKYKLYGPTDCTIPYLLINNKEKVKKKILRKSLHYLRYKDIYIVECDTYFVASIISFNKRFPKFGNLGTTDSTLTRIIASNPLYNTATF